MNRHKTDWGLLLRGIAPNCKGRHAIILRNKKNFQWDYPSISISERKKKIRAQRKHLPSDEARAPPIASLPQEAIPGSGSCLGSFWVDVSTPPGRPHVPTHWVLTTIQFPCLSVRLDRSSPLYTLIVTVKSTSENGLIGMLRRSSIRAGALPSEAQVRSCSLAKYYISKGYLVSSPPGMS